MLIVLIEEFNKTPLYCVEEIVYKRILKEFTKVFGNETVAEKILSKFWHYTLRQLSTTSVVDIMNCFILL